MTSNQIHRLATSYRNAKTVHRELQSEKDVSQATVFEIGAAVGCLETLLLREMAKEAKKAEGR